MSPLCRAVRACAYSCRHSETTQAAVTNRNTARPGSAANPVQVAHPVTAVTASIPRKTGLTLRSLRLVAVVMGLPGRYFPAVGLPDGTGRTGKTSRGGAGVPWKAGRPGLRQPFRRAGPARSGPRRRTARPNPVTGPDIYGDNGPRALPH